MAIKIKNLEQISEQYREAKYYFSDLHLDFKRESITSRTSNTAILGTDIAMDYDVSAIKNSLRNLFNTKPGQRFLFPKYGLDLNIYLFEQINERNAKAIGTAIVETIKLYEPRVEVQRCLVEAVPDDNVFEITLTLGIPSFNTIATINTTLDVTNKTFIFTKTSRNI